MSTEWQSRGNGGPTNGHAYRLPFPRPAIPLIAAIVPGTIRLDGREAWIRGRHFISHDHTGSVLERAMANSSFQVLASRHFTEWMAEQRLSLALTTYQAGRLLLIGRKPNGQLTVMERGFPRCLGLWGDGQTLWMSSQYQLWRFENVLETGEHREGADRLFVPRVGVTTGELDIHDIGVDASGQPVFVNTLFNCLATIDDRYNFRPLWRPPFISRLVAEDRCHLNGVALAPAAAEEVPRDAAPVDSSSNIHASQVAQRGEPRYVTACARSDVVDGWRDQRSGGGCVLDVRSNEVVAADLSMPHSPRLRIGDDTRRLWLLDSGQGYLGYVPLGSKHDSGGFERVAFCPGYARGLCLWGSFAIVGLSRPREATFQGLPLDAELARLGASARTGLLVIDLNSGDVVHWLRIEGAVTELYDVVVLPDVVRPQALGFKTDDIRRHVWVDEQGKSRCWTGVNREAAVPRQNSLPS